MHTKDARALGETEQRIHVLAAWREAPFYTERERAVLAWAESVTRVAETHVPDEIYEEARRHLEEEELITLTWAVVAVNSWNRLLIATRQPADTYRSPYERASEQERETREAVAV